MLETNAPAQMVAKARCRNGRNGDTLAGPGEREAAVVTRLPYASSAGRLTGPIPEQRRKPLPCEYVVATGPHRIQGRAAGAGTPVPGGPPRRLDRLRGRRPDRHGLPAGALDRLASGTIEAVSWSEIELSLGTTVDGLRDALLLSGPEPDFRWHAFADQVTELCRQLETVPAIVELAAGIQSVLEERLHQAGIPAMGLWARVPPYLAGGSHPPAALTLVRTMARLASIEVETTELKAAS